LFEYLMGIEATAFAQFHLALLCFALLCFVCLFAWGLTALSAQIGYIAP